MSDIQYLKRDGLPTLAYVYSEGEIDDLPVVVFCGGYRSDMSGTKATYFEAQCRTRGQSYLRLDYSGHGYSEGVFDDGTIGDWAQDAGDVTAHVTGNKKIVLIGSSMGGWIALILSKRMPEKISGFIGIAAAPDFTEEIYHDRLSEEQRHTLETVGEVVVPNDYSDEPYVFKKSFFDEARGQLVLNQMLTMNYPVRLFQGGQDKDVLPEVAENLRSNIQSPDIAVILIEDGDHRLSRDEDLIRIDQEIQALSATEN